MAVISPPRLEGDKKPSNANIIVTSVIANICILSEYNSLLLKMHIKFPPQFMIAPH
jgi:hypothetical protein